MSQTEQLIRADERHSPNRFTGEPCSAFAALPKSLPTMSLELGDTFVDVEYEVEQEEGSPGWNQGWVIRTAVYVTDVFIGGKSLGLHNIVPGQVRLWESSIKAGGR